MKIKFNSDDNIPLKKTIEIRIIALVVSVVFLKINEYYQHVFLDECLHKI